MLKFLLLVNKQGHTRVSQYYEYLELEERTNLEAEITRKCLARSDDQCPFMEFKNFKVIYRRYASLLFIVGVDSDENELSILEFIHTLVETLDRYFSSVVSFDLCSISYTLMICPAWFPRGCWDTPI
ncbi:AP-4 complex subunit sigma-like [Orbicella faveolata]|uniref:AP-4 complex subunit sigma-like n=1 Tax=Orbicella faveolata TaxID=48498 RepID=UPI0009E5C446|nr:AP-4 complex subunit sigma-like [Orbicella faveolata]